MEKTKQQRDLSDVYVCVFLFSFTKMFTWNGDFSQKGSQHNHPLVMNLFSFKQLRKHIDVVGGWDWKF